MTTSPLRLLGVSALLLSLSSLVHCHGTMQDDDDSAAPVGVIADEAPASPPSAALPPPATRLAASPIDGCSPPAQGEVRVETGGLTWALPLVHTGVEAVISGLVADVSVVQSFANPFDHPIELTYLFPLPDEAAVDAMTVRIGDRVLDGSIHRREDAEAIYNQAKADGRTAALLNQERPNVFTQRVANVLPGEIIEVSIHLVEVLKYEDEQYRWAFPLVVGPRYTPGDAPDPSVVAPYLPERGGNDVRLWVSLDAGLPLTALRSPSHDVVIDRRSAGGAEITLAEQDRIPNKDFVIAFAVAGSQPQVAVLAEARAGQGTFLLVVQPPQAARMAPDEIVPKEMVFVVDTSCSMSGFPLDAARDAMRLAIDEMNPRDRFLVMDFNDRVSQLAPRPLPNGAASRRRARAFVDAFEGSGGTRMLDGIEASLDLPADPELLRTVLFLTDGYIGNEADILAAIEARLGRSRLFSLGIGSSVNRYLLDRMAKVGRGAVDVVLHAEEADAAVARFYDRIRRPVLTDIEVHIEGVAVRGLTPDPIADLFAGQPLVLLGRYVGGGRATVTVSGRSALGPWRQELDVELPPEAHDHPGLHSLWARRTIADLELANHGGGDAALTEQMTTIALAHGIMSRTTAFVAVDTEVVNPHGAPTPVDVPLEIPEGVDPALACAFSDALDGGEGLGGMGHSGLGSGGSGYGIGYGIGSGGLGVIGAGLGGGGSRGRSSAPAPVAIAAPAPAVLGSIDKSVIDRIVRGQINAIRHCYQRELARQPRLAGKLVVRFEVDADGGVSAATLSSDTLGNALVSDCVLGRFRRLRFPETPGGGAVVVSYPLVFAGDGTGD